MDSLSKALGVWRLDGSGSRLDWINCATLAGSASIAS
jgi:hypothetical protein